MVRLVLMKPEAFNKKNSKRFLRTGLIVLVSALIIFLSWYYQTLIKSRPIKNFNLIGICSTGDTLELETRESAKYLSGCNTVQLKDTLEVFAKTTTVFNPFSTRKTQITIGLNPKIRYVKIIGKVISRDSIRICAIKM